MRTIPHWINGAPVAGGSDTIDVLDPATDQPSATRAHGGRSHVDAAIAAAAERLRRLGRHAPVQAGPRAVPVP